MTGTTIIPERLEAIDHLHGADRWVAYIAARVSIDEDGCWIWTGSSYARGYGRANVSGTAMQAHRLAYRVLVGPIFDGLHVHHECAIRNCVNPAHLRLVTPAENNAEARARRDSSALAKARQAWPEACAVGLIERMCAVGTAA